MPKLPQGSLPHLPALRPNLVDARGKALQPGEALKVAHDHAAKGPMSLADFKAQLGLTDIGTLVPNLDSDPTVMAIKELIDDVALAIEQRLGSIAAIRAAGGPYADSLVIQQNRRLHDAAAAAIATVINHPRLKPIETD